MDGRVVRARQYLAASGAGVNRVGGEELSAEWCGALTAGGGQKLLPSAGNFEEHNGGSAF
jgi:hypothetical protein